MESAVSRETPSPIQAISATSKDVPERTTPTGLRTGRRATGAAGASSAAASQERSPIGRAYARDRLDALLNLTEEAGADVLRYTGQGYRHGADQTKRVEAGAAWSEYDDQDAPRPRRRRLNAARGPGPSARKRPRPRTRRRTEQRIRRSGASAGHVMIGEAGLAKSLGGRQPRAAKSVGRRWPSGRCGRPSTLSWQGWIASKLKVTCGHRRASLQRAGRALASRFAPTTSAPARSRPRLLQPRRKIAEAMGLLRL